MSLLRLISCLRHSVQRLETALAEVTGLDKLGPALAVHGGGVLKEPLDLNEKEDCPTPSFLDSIFWMAAPKKRRTIEINRCRRRDPRKLIDIKTNIEPCPECGNLKQKHVLCGFCYAKIQRETALIRKQIFAMEGKPLNTPAVETVVLYKDEIPREFEKDKRIVERERKRPSWFIQH
ncbi:large ribosomal subunit protein bL32m [Denticeps clupeoides]|uniref:Large ribosomal subunit protein bL32m n=1 Tax=Denticeps clupeoides TaxID=299321 RepID=A0AAY4CDN8_9TELE|nr:39S ribosomal protein L32, mitochondrial [Denticeps clupeoides]